MAVGVAVTIADPPVADIPGFSGDSSQGDLLEAQASGSREALPLLIKRALFSAKAADGQGQGR